MARAKGISKGQGYLARVFTVEYDLAGMMQAYGKDFIIWLMDEIEAGRVDIRQNVDRWGAHLALHADAQFAEHRADYEQKDESDLVDEILKGAA